MKFGTKIAHYDCNSLEELIEKRESIKESLINEKCEYYLTNSFKAIYHKITVSIYVDAMCKYLVFNIKGADHINKEVLIHELEVSLIDGLFENWDCFDNYEIVRL